MLCNLGTKQIPRTIANFGLFGTKQIPCTIADFGYFGTKPVPHTVADFLYYVYAVFSISEYVEELENAMKKLAPKFLS